MRVCRALAGDIPAIAALFTECFADSVLHYCTHAPHPKAMEDIFSLVFKTEPAAVFVAKDENNSVCGYCLAPARLSQVWRQALKGGHLLRWAWRWSTGQYGLGLRPVLLLLWNKTTFLRSSFVPTLAADARILSVAVHPSCRSQGIATGLLQTALDYLKTQQAQYVRLEVRPKNKPAIAVYEKHGFCHGGVSGDSQGDWLIMVKDMRCYG